MLVCIAWPFEKTLSRGLFTGIEGGKQAENAPRPAMNDLLDRLDIQKRDIAVAFSLLSRIPVHPDPDAAETRAAAAAWAWPIVGATHGAIAGVLGSIALALGAPAGVTAALALAVLVVLSGAMHEDGLADCADGLGGGRDRDHRLAIMKDSRIGAYGAVALTLALLARWSGIEALTEAGCLFWPLVAIGAASRLPMIWAMAFMASARDNGLSASVGLPPPGSLAVASVLVLVLSLLVFGLGAVPLLFWTIVAPLPIYLLADRLIGGQTGDVLGGGQQMSEIAALAAA
jgi:adenosylcobinamide-GDP ribazoletransferase